MTATIYYEADLDWNGVRVRAEFEPFSPGSGFTPPDGGALDRLELVSIDRPEELVEFLVEFDKYDETAAWAAIAGDPKALLARVEANHRDAIEEDAYAARTEVAR